MYHRGGGTGPADPAAAGPIIYSKITRSDKELSQEYFLIKCSHCLIVYAHNYLFMFTDWFYIS